MKINFKRVLYMSVLCVRAVFLSYKPLKFSYYFYTVVFLCGVYCILKPYYHRSKRAVENFKV